MEIRWILKICLVAALTSASVAQAAPEYPISFRDTKNQTVDVIFTIDGLGGIKQRKANEEAWAQVGVPENENVTQLLRLGRRLFYIYTESLEGKVTEHIGELSVDGVGVHPSRWLPATSAGLVTSLMMSQSANSLIDGGQSILSSVIGYAGLAVAAPILVVSLGGYLYSIIGSINCPTDVKYARGECLSEVAQNDKLYKLTVTSKIFNSDKVLVDVNLEFGTGSKKGQARLSQFTNQTICEENLLSANDTIN